MAKTQEAEPQSGLAGHSKNSGHPKAGLADHLSDTSGRGLLRRGRFRLDAKLVKIHRWALVCYFVILAFIAFWPTPVDKPVAGDLDALLDFLHRRGIPEWFNYGFIEACANVVLFAPAGLLLAFTFPRKRWWQLLALGAAASGAIELGQLLFLPQRFSSWQDILMNTLGVGVGLLLAALLKRLSPRRPALTES